MPRSDKKKTYKFRPEDYEKLYAHVKKEIIDEEVYLSGEGIAEVIVRHFPYVGTFSSESACRVWNCLGYSANASLKGAYVQFTRSRKRERS